MYEVILKVKEILFHFKINDRDFVQIEPKDDVKVKKLITEVDNFNLVNGVTLSILGNLISLNIDIKLDFKIDIHFNFN